MPNRVPEVKKDSARNGTGEENSRKILESVPNRVPEVKKDRARNGTGEEKLGILSLTATIQPSCIYATSGVHSLPQGPRKQLERHG